MAMEAYRFILEGVRYESIRACVRATSKPIKEIKANWKSVEVVDCRNDIVINEGREPSKVTDYPPTPQSHLDMIAHLYNKELKEINDDVNWFSDIQ